MNICRIFATGVISGAIWLCSITPAWACSCLPTPVHKTIAGASLIFRGTVRTTQNGKLDITANTLFQVDQAYKGAPGPEVVIGHALDGAGCGIRYKEGESVMVLASGSAAAGFHTGLCMTPWPDVQKELEAYIGQQKALEDKLLQHGQLAPLRALGELHTKYGNLPLAESAYTQLLELTPQDGTARLARAQLRYAEARYEAALADYREASHRTPESVEARRGSAMALLNLGRAGEISPRDRDFSGLEAVGPQFKPLAGQDLRGAIFRKAKLSGVNFSGADLRGADFSDANLHSCDFSGATLDGASFSNLQSSYKTSFRDASMAGTNFAGAHLFQVSLQGTRLEQADFSKARLEATSLEGASITHARFKVASLRLSKLRGVDLSGQDLSGAILSGSDLHDALLHNTNLKSANLGRTSQFSYRVTDLRGADLQGADVTDVQWEGALVDCRTRLPAGILLASLPVLPLWTACSGERPAVAPLPPSGFQRGPQLKEVDAPNSMLAGLQLAGLAFWSSRLDGSDLSRTVLTEADIQSSSFNGSRFDFADLSRAWMVDVSMRNASLAYTKLSGARLEGVDFSGANFDGAKMDGACASAKTIWPVGFDPVARGVRGTCR